MQIFTVSLTTWKVLKLLVSVSNLVCGYDVTSTWVKTIVSKYDVMERGTARIRRTLVANEN